MIGRVCRGRLFGKLVQIGVGEGDMAKGKGIIEEKQGYLYTGKIPLIDMWELCHSLYFTFSPGI